MKRTRYSNLLDIIVVDDPAQIRALSDDRRIDRVFDRRPFLNGLLLKRRLGVLSYRGKRFPHMIPFADPGRFDRDDSLWEKFNQKSSAIAEGPEELEPLARWIKGEKEGVHPGVMVQQIIGSFFIPDYRATAESWAAAVTINTASRTRNFPLLFMWWISGKIGRAKKRLGLLAGNDLSCIHGTTVAVHNIVAGVQRMKYYYTEPKSLEPLSPEKAIELFLSPPPVVLRQAKSDGEAGGCPFSKYSLLFLQLGKAGSRNDAKDLIFMTDSWSRCPAERWVPALLAGIWKRACAFKL